MKVSKSAKIRNRYNQVPYLTHVSSPIISIHDLMHDNVHVEMNLSFPDIIGPFLMTRSFIALLSLILLSYELDKHVPYTSSTTRVCSPSWNQLSLSNMTAFWIYITLGFLVLGINSLILLMFSYSPLIIVTSYLSLVH